MEDVTNKEGQDVTQNQVTNPENNQLTLPTTLDELQALLQREGDRRVTSAQRKWQEKQLEIIKTEKAKAAEEADRLAKMTAAEREKAKFEKEKQEFFEEKAKMEKERLLNQTERELVLTGLDSSFANYVIANTAEEIKDNITKLKNLFDNAVNKAVNERITTPSPKSGSGNFLNKKRESLMDVINSKRVR